MVGSRAVTGMRALAKARRSPLAIGPAKVPPIRPNFNSHAHGAQRLQRILPLMGSDPIARRSGWPLLD